MGEYSQNQQDKSVRTLSTAKMQSRQLKSIADNRLRNPLIQPSQFHTLQRFAIPKALSLIKKDVDGIENDMRPRYFGDGDTTRQIEGSEEWAQDSRSAALRKLNEWDALKEMVELGAEPKFGVDDVTEPDVYEERLFGRTNVVENKYVSGKRNRITQNVHDAITQLITGNRPKNYYGRLTANIILSDETKEDLKQNTNNVGFSRMQTGWAKFAQTLKKNTTITKPFNLYIRINNFPNDGDVYEQEL